MNINMSLLRYHKDIQENARCLYHILREKLAYPECQCGFVHTAHLQLQMRYTAPLQKSNLSTSAVGEYGSLRFSCMFSMEEQFTDWTTTWQEFQLECIDDRRDARDVQNPITMGPIHTQPPISSQTLPQPRTSRLPSGGQDTAATPEKDRSPPCGPTNNADELLRIPQTLYATPHI